MKVKAKHDSRV